MAGSASRAIAVERDASHIHCFREQIDSDYSLYGNSVFIFDCC
jgi:hypothetical protein